MERTCCPSANDYSAFLQSLCIDHCVIFLLMLNLNELSKHITCLCSQWLVLNIIYFTQAVFPCMCVISSSDIIFTQLLISFCYFSVCILMKPALIIKATQQILCSSWHTLPLTLNLVATHLLVCRTTQAEMHTDASPTNKKKPKLIISPASQSPLIILKHRPSNPAALHWRPLWRTCPGNFIVSAVVKHILCSEAHIWELNESTKPP